MMNTGSSSGGRTLWASTTSGSGKRIQKELKELDCPPLSSAGPIAYSINHWLATFLGSPGINSFILMFLFHLVFLYFILSFLGTPYEGGIFFLDILFPNEYPFKPPKVMFKTRIYHCNVDSSGNVYLDILKDGWSPALTISQVLLAVRSIFLTPDPYNALVPSIAHLYQVDRKRHDELAAEWTHRFAK
ncbi:constitutive photomorphogenesis protein 10-like isoform X1 [Chenopodium quinoa]|uniref:constitutive photomorphogenesis protein 10-like isoform X1 n=1 Tax=Chenopodium quinoa TaxID=63459 RepID=UPI000B783217|nr:constitutive photomorphogenesis protein 10-like isoform X1 [Chenopodium quinoa]